MSDQPPFYAPDRHRAPQEAKASEGLFEFLRGHEGFPCELRDHGKWGIEAQFYRKEEFAISQRFDTGTQAVQCAEEERRVLESGEA
jgi:hypothetical protein